MIADDPYPGIETMCRSVLKNRSQSVKTASYNLRHGGSKQFHWLRMIDEFGENNWDMVDFAWKSAGIYDVAFVPRVSHKS
jgi:hypothetical protein